MAICRVAKRGFYSFANKNICDERAEVSHARCAKFIYSNTIKSFLLAFFQKNENLYFTNYSLNPNLSIIIEYRKRNELFARSFEL